MCLTLFAWKAHPRYTLIVASNRDEYHRRPSALAHRWVNNPNITAGQDLEQLGTWMGVTKTGRWAAVTNYREPQQSTDSKKSRGHLTTEYLMGGLSPQLYAASLTNELEAYKGFNLLVGDCSSITYVTNRQDKKSECIDTITKPGIYGLSNHLLDTQWPKVKNGKTQLHKLINEHDVIQFTDVLEFMSDRTKPSDELLPHSGVSLDLERALSPIFIETPEYGTRATSLLLINEAASEIQFSEATFDAKGTELSNQTYIV